MLQDQSERAESDKQPANVHKTHRAPAAARARAAGEGSLAWQIANLFEGMMEQEYAANDSLAGLARPLAMRSEGLRLILTGYNLDMFEIGTGLSPLWHAVLNDDPRACVCLTGIRESLADTQLMVNAFYEGRLDTGVGDSELLESQRQRLATAEVDITVPGQTAEAFAVWDASRSGTDRIPAVLMEGVGPYQRLTERERWLSEMHPVLLAAGGWIVTPDNDIAQTLRDNPPNVGIDIEDLAPETEDELLGLYDRAGYRTSRLHLPTWLGLQRCRKRLWKCCGRAGSLFLFRTASRRKGLIFLSCLVQRVLRNSSWPAIISSSNQVFNETSRASGKIFPQYQAFY